jgi:hypothetical protein
MASIPLASFLAGSLLTLLVPVGLLIGLVTWYVIAVRRVPDDPAEEMPHAAPRVDPPNGEPRP